MTILMGGPEPLIDRDDVFPGVWHDGFAAGLEGTVCVAPPTCDTAAARACWARGHVRGVFARRAEQRKAKGR